MKQILSVLSILCVLAPFAALADAPSKIIASGNEFFSWTTEFMKYIKDYKELLDVAYGICQKTKDYISNNNITLRYEGVEYDSDRMLNCDIATQPNVTQEEIESLMQRCGMVAIMIIENGKNARAAALASDSHKAPKERLIANIAKRQCARFNPRTVTNIDISCRIDTVTRCLVKETIGEPGYDDTTYPTCCIVSDRLVDEINIDSDGNATIKTTVSYADFTKVAHDAMLSNKADKLTLDNFDDKCK